MANTPLTPETLYLLAGALLSLAARYTPGLNEKFNALLPEHKRLWMLALLALVAAGVVGSSCARLGLFAATCDQNGFAEVLRVFVFALVGNQAAFLISPNFQAK